MAVPSSSAVRNVSEKFKADPATYLKKLDAAVIEKQSPSTLSAPVW